MMTKKLLTLGLALTLMSPLASYAKMGTETSGGGDAVYVNNQMVIRDLVEKGQTQLVMNNLKFLDQSPKFRKIIAAISKAQPLFAVQVVEDLLKDRIYLVPTSLPMLPYAVTTTFGDAAEVQLAIREDNNILIAPAFFESSQQEYVLLHEALHGILEDNEGPMHHLRVRSIVKYIHDNIDNLDSEELGNFLRKNNYNPGFRTSMDMNYIKEAWNKENNPSLRCYLAVASTYSYRYAKTIETFDRMNCKNNYQNLKSDSDLRKFLAERFPELLEAKLKSPSINYMDRYYPEFRAFKVEKKSILNKTNNERQKIECQSVIGGLENTLIVKANMRNSLNLVRLLNKELSSQSISEIEKDVLKDIIGDLQGSQSWDSFEEENKLTTLLEIKDSDLIAINKQVNACKAIFTEL